MKSNKSNKFIISIIKEVNPLELPKEDGTSYVFHSMVDCYLHVIKVMCGIATKGYVDLLLIIAELYHCTFTKAKDIYYCHFKRNIPDRIILIMLEEPKAKHFFRKFLISAHGYTNTIFSSDAFETAFEMFKNQLEYERNNKIIK